MKSCLRGGARSVSGPALVRTAPALPTPNPDAPASCPSLTQKAANHSVCGLGANHLQPSWHRHGGLDRAMGRCSSCVHLVCVCEGVLLIHRTLMIWVKTTLSHFTLKGRLAATQQRIALESSRLSSTLLASRHDSPPRSSPLAKSLLYGSSPLAKSLLYGSSSLATSLPHDSSPRLHVQLLHQGTSSSPLSDTLSTSLEALRDPAPSAVRRSRRVFFAALGRLFPPHRRL
ncbi:hypothetical protein FQA47_017079 [Oryzias melastigma]|uniref:Uncharacterized protein n=1 Tax=Oryzias melastigma TaxID=30732 RepID=A0A834BS37_ORYME|nr:hypothetical protein FQA47_017079 [Oryzias melastigma]